MGIMSDNFLTHIPEESDSRWTVSSVDDGAEIHQATHTHSAVIAKAGVDQCKIIFDVVPGWTAVQHGDVKGFIETPARRG
jgi:hypothetical protein